MASVPMKRKRPDGDHGADPLQGVIACLTGLTHDRKIHFHEIIESLGGHYTRDFDLDKNTHLVAETAEGAKYDLAASCSRIHVVTPSWLVSCSEEGERVDEALHSLNAKPAAKQISTPNIISQIDAFMDRQDEFFSLFETQHFYLLGFEEDKAVRNRLGKLIRRGKGTIYWEMNEEITTIILHDTCDSSLRKAAKILTENHINMPSAVSPAWVIESCKINLLAKPCLFPPIESAATSKKAEIPSKAKLSRTNSASAVFRGCLFSLVRIAPPTWGVDFDSKQEEKLIKAHGGQMLSLRLIDAMRTDANNNGGQRRKCHVVCWGGRPQLQLNPILSQLKRHDLCDVEMVTPMWIKTCIRAKKRVRTEALTIALLPQAWPLRKLETPISVALTGFSGTEKIAVAYLIKSIGGAVTDNMDKTNTHLICKDKANKLKIEKASQWELKAVSIDWLSHIVEFGFCGKEKENGGCEHRFQFQ